MSTQSRRAPASGLWPARAGLAGFAALALLAFFAALALGPVTLPLARVAQVLLDGIGGHRAQAGTGLRDTVIVLDVRLPRAVLGALVGPARLRRARSCRACSAIRWPIPA